MSENICVPEKKEDVRQQLERLMAESDKAYDIVRIRAAADMATAAHNGQCRRSGEEYICHPLHVACILVEIGMDSDAVAAALLHDVVEDTDVELAEIAQQFGQDVADLVDGVTKITKMTFSTREEQHAENVRKMLLAMSKDVRVMIIKLADRLHNMRTSEGWDPQKQRDKARETLDIYAPLAHRLGIRAIKEELEDLSLRVLDPVAYKEIEENLALHADERAAFLANIQQRLLEHLADYGLTAHISGRIKSFAGIYRKMYMRGKAFDEIFDIYAIRIIVDNVNDCYNVLGIVHEMFRPLPNRFKDYISTPKPNMYQSLHTTVVSKEKIPFEVQIRTWEMHYTAEYGIAAHWKYKAGIQKKDKLEERLAWVRQFIESQQDVDDAEDIVRSIKTDLDIDDVFVFTPKGDVITLPEGSTVIDFAYAIHTAVGNRMIGAKVNGRIVPLDYKVKTGEIVEVLTTSAANHGPSRDWLTIVHTGEARNKIRSWFKKERREENIQRGREELERELSRNLIRLSPDRMEQFLLAQAKKQHCATLEDFYAAIGYGGVLLSRLIPRLKEEYSRMLRDEQLATAPIVPSTPPVRRQHHNKGVIIDDVEDCLVKFAQCCNPVPGDPIIGFITRGYGVSVHRRDCTNVPKNMAEAPNRERWVTVHWEQDVDTAFHANLYIVAHDGVNLLLKLTTLLAGLHIPVHSINARDVHDGAVVNITVSVNSVEHLQFVMQKLRAIDGVDEVQRTGLG
ncbi:MAG: bifunctional (p)ppGpp synthetase/guanosine-3',5'-bis(diphosphate) 3'-pyrophosphohydrolase [Clostridia bacterium]|nr:bifunctional (p)ppGpp synthetase/guanosine-3',5'-bis(diphosphate) 3'-pyrophosphohydrolase [Clostridia bacterium]